MSQLRTYTHIDETLVIIDGLRHTHTYTLERIMMFLHYQLCCKVHTCVFFVDGPSPNNIMVVQKSSLDIIPF